MREAGRRLLQHTLAELEPDSRAQAPARLTFQRETYRRRYSQPKTIYSSFGPLEYARFRYEACEPGEPSIFPLDLLLGLEAHLATPALAERVGRLAVDHEQRQVLATLASEHGVCWSVTTLRKVTASLADGFASFREPAQVKKALEWLEKAFASKGAYRPVLAMGRDGIMIPMRKQGFKEASTGTLAIYGRNKKRLGTLYLGCMPEPGQETLTRQLKSLIEKILTAWHARKGDCPRLVYLTDGGYHPRDFFRRVLRKMTDPWHQATKGKLSWQWILDYGPFHKFCNDNMAETRILMGVDVAELMERSILARLQLRQQTGRGPVRRWSQGPEVVPPYASLATRPHPGHHAGVAFGQPAPGPRPTRRGSRRSIPGRLSLPPQEFALDAVCQVPATRHTNWQRRDGSRLQDCVHATPQTLGHELAQGKWPSDCQLAHPAFERRLARSPRSKPAQPSPSSNGKSSTIH